jgi:diguanylate cyclase (GGDEF)-like protein/PAS domain S-box-containing protein
MTALTLFEDLQRRADTLAAEATEQRRIAESLRDSEFRYRHLFDANPLPMWVYDLESLAFLAVNEAAVEHYGYTREQFLAMTIMDIRPEPEVLALQEIVKKDLSGIVHAGIWRHRKRDGAIIKVEVTSHPIDFSGRRAKLVLAHDVTERVEQERKLARLSRVRAVSSGISSAMLRLRDRDELLKEACRVAATEGVFPVAWVSAIDARAEHYEIVAWHGDTQAVDLIKKLAQRETWSQQDRPSVRAARAGRSIVMNDVSTDPTLTPVRDELLRGAYRSCAAFPLFVDGVVVAVLVLLARERDVFDAEEIALLDSLAADLSYALDYIEKSQRLEYLDSYDTLTGLPNVRLFGDRLEQFVNAARQERNFVCVVVIDLERFTQINDTLGRNAADELLRQIASRFSEFLVEPYALGRVAADTFVAAGPGDSESVVNRLRDRMLDALKQPFSVDGQDVRITAQAGIALFPADGEDGRVVFKNAEAALKLAKSSGKPYLYYSADVNTRMAERLALEDQLRAAVDAQQFVLHYQPRVDMISGELVGAEALIRWQHPERGLMPPAKFIGLAEETGLIVPIGSWAINAVCAQQAAWIASGIHTVPIAVNLSSVQFDKDDLLESVRDALSTHELEAKHLELELTETAVMSDSAAAAKTLQALSEAGVRLALDDFGTGYSSLAVLKRFPFRSVKIDQSFVADITHNAEDAAIATAIIAMAHRLNLKVIAEGVETQGQFNYLRAQACDEMQGNFFSPAVPKDVFESQLHANKHISMPAATENTHTLLLVDDEPGIRTALTRMLRGDGYRILTASSGAEGLELLSVNTVQVIISDQRMPGMSGTEFLNTVKELYPDTVRIILSGYTDLQVVTESVNRGAVFKFLTKPWNDDLLREQVRDAFRRYR